MWTKYRDLDAQAVVVRWQGHQGMKSKSESVTKCDHLMLLFLR